MQFFINELTLQEQYCNGQEFEDAIRRLLLTAKKIEEVDNPKELLSDKTKLAGFKPVAGKFFHVSLNEVDKDYRELFKKFIYETSDDWRKNQKHAITDSFMIGNNSVTDTSLAELAERKFIEGMPCALLNFQGSTLASQQVISVIKNGLTTIVLDCIEDDLNLSGWISQHGINAYNFSSTVPPSDNQTVLRQARRFVRTHKVEQGRTVYREKRTGYFWFVDHLHCGAGSHIEVFDQRGGHVGDSDLEGNINYGNKNATKRINI